MGILKVEKLFLTKIQPGKVCQFSGALSIQRLAHVWPALLCCCSLVSDVSYIWMNIEMYRRSNICGQME